MSNEEWRFLDAACSTGQDWAADFRTLADAWNACPKASWLRWALNRLGRREDANRAYNKSADQIRRVIPNPWTEGAEMFCEFCPGIYRLTLQEQHDSRLVGSMARCRKHLKAVAPELAVAA